MSIENNLTPVSADSFSFDESKFKIRSRAILGAPEIPTMIRVLVKGGLAKTENQAVAILLGITIAMVGVSVFFISRSMSVPPATINPALISSSQ